MDRPGLSDPEFAAVQKRVFDAVGTWKERLWLWGWNVQLRWGDGAIPDGDMAVASCDARWEYMRATLTFDVRGMADEQSIDAVVIHELLHALVNEMRMLAVSADDITHEERVVTHLTNVITDLAGVGADQVRRFIAQPEGWGDGAVWETE